MIPDQKRLWDKKHGEGEHEDFRNSPSPFAQRASEYMPAKSKILELGCGVGRDAAYFAHKGHQVIATDFSNVILERNRQKFSGRGIRFEQLDMEQDFPYADSEFDVVYANLSLHYYLDKKTRAIVSEVTRVLKPGGIFAFACKSTNDFHYGNGEEVEANVFVSKTGHVRHLFTQDYAQELVSDDFELLFMEEVEETYSGQKSAMLQCIVRKNSSGPAA